jgi:predicted transport protein
MQAGFLAGLYLNGGNPVYQNEDNLLENQFVKCDAMRQVFEHISGKIMGLLPETQLIPKKTYLSFTAKREFAAINIKPSEIRLGVDLGEEPFSETLQKSKLTGPMPRISHMITLSAQEDFNEQVAGFLQKSYERTHKK